MTEEVTVVKLIAHDVDDESFIIAYTLPVGCTIAQAASYAKTLVGVGNPFYAISTWPSGVDDANLAVNFSSAATCSEVVAENEIAIQQQLGNAELQAIPNDLIAVAT